MPLPIKVKSSELSHLANIKGDAWFRIIFCIKGWSECVPSGPTLAQAQSLCPNDGGGGGAGGDCDIFSWDEGVTQSGDRFFCVYESEEHNGDYCAGGPKDVDEVYVREIILNGDGDPVFGGYTFDNRCESNGGAPTCDNGTCVRGGCALP